MAFLPIVQAGDPVLREKASLVDPSLIGTADFNQLIGDMVDTMHEAPGVGLAAPQIGLGLQLFVVEDKPEHLDQLTDEVRAERLRTAVPLTVCINPTLEPVGDEMITFYEGCLSVDSWMAETPRYKSVRVRCLNENGESVVLEWEGWPARILQHEFDHLQGTLYIDKMDTRTFTFTGDYMGDEDDDEN